jgi:hypothetical protein
MVERRPPGQRLPSLLVVTLRRGIIAGRLYLVMATVISLILAVVLLRTARGLSVFVATFPLEIPMFASLGAMGGMMLFVGDRSTGVLEYRISYRIPPRTLFVNSLLVTVVLSTIGLGSALAVGLTGYVAVGGKISTNLQNSLLGYTIPMTYAAALFASISGMIWSALSSTRAGLNSPAGIAPILGIAPPILVLIVADATDKAADYYVTIGTSLGFLVLVLFLLAASSRLMDRERYLSTM